MTAAALQGGDGSLGIELSKISTKSNPDANLEKADCTAADTDELIRTFPTIEVKWDTVIYQCLCNVCQMATKTME